MNWQLNSTYLVMPDEAAWEELKGGVPSDAVVTVQGVLYRNPPEDAPEDYVPEARPGWNIMLRLVEGTEVSDELKPFLIAPQYPACKYAGT